MSCSKVWTSVTYTAGYFFVCSHCVSDIDFCKMTEFLEPRGNQGLEKQWWNDGRRMRIKRNKSEITSAWAVALGSDVGVWELCVVIPCVWSLIVLELKLLVTLSVTNRKEKKKKSVLMEVYELFFSACVVECNHIL